MLSSQVRTAITMLQHMFSKLWATIDMGTLLISCGVLGTSVALQHWRTLVQVSNRALHSDTASHHCCGCWCCGRCCCWFSCCRCCRWSCLNNIYRHSSSDTADKQASARQAARQLSRLLRTLSTSMRGREAKSARTCIGSLLASFLMRHACHKLLLNRVGLGRVLVLLLNVVSPADFLVDVSSHNSSTAWSMPSPTSWLLAPWCSPTGFPEHHLVDTVALQTATRCPHVVHRDKQVLLRNVEVLLRGKPVILERTVLE